VTKAQLTTIWLYLRNAHNYVQAAFLTAKSSSDTDVQARLSDLHQRAQAELSHIDQLRGALDGEPPSA
jgi:hypothetical protein